MTPAKKLRQLLGRKDKVLAVLGAPNAFHAKIMEANGVEACFVGTSITGGNYTGQPDLGILSMTECVEFAKWIARAVKIPVILDGDTGHGGIMAVRRLVRDTGTDGAPVPQYCTRQSPADPAQVPQKSMV